jgi:hypothetical protein
MIWSHMTYTNTDADQLQRIRVRLAYAQGVYYVCGALWPLVHLASFEAVTGNKRDEWLVRTVAGIVLLLGFLLLHDAHVRKHIARTLRILAGGIALVLGSVAIISSLTGRISWLYFPDGLIHLSFALGWLLFGRFRLIVFRGRKNARLPAQGYYEGNGS